jgi:predicted CXXCH cytochrome family protein
MLVKPTRLLALSALVLAAALALARPAHADDGGGTYVGPEVCKACHQAQSDAWQDAPHADASKVDAFLADWKSLNSPNYCLQCHTTGYDPNTGHYALEGVTCEACHGPFNPEHPQKPMLVQTDPAACGACHKSTFNEWEISQHGKSGIGCATCHDVHGQTVKTGDASTLCVKCHADQASSVAHASSSGQGLTCANCHIGPLSGEVREGHVKTGHTFEVGTGTCSRCHAEEVHKGVSAMMGGSPDEAALAAEATPAATAAPADEGTELRQSNVALPAAASAAIGLAVGLVWARWQNRRA